MSSDEQFNLPDEVKKAFKDLRLKRRYKWLFFAVEEESRTYSIDAAEGDQKKTLEDLANALPENEPRYVIYDHSYKTADKRDTDKLYFVMWSPKTCSTHMQMIYLHARSQIRSICEGCYDLSIGDAEDLIDTVRRDTNVGKVDADEEEDENWMDP